MARLGISPTMNYLSRISYGNISEKNEILFFFHFGKITMIRVTLRKTFPKVEE